MTDIYNDDKRPNIDDTSFYAPMVRSVDHAIADGIRHGADPALVAEQIVVPLTDPATPTAVLIGDDAIRRGTTTTAYSS